MWICLHSFLKDLVKFSTFDNWITKALIINLWVQILFLYLYRVKAVPSSISNNRTIQLRSLFLWILVAIQITNSQMRSINKWNCVSGTIQTQLFSKCSIAQITFNLCAEIPWLYRCLIKIYLRSRTKDLEGQ